MVRPTPEADPAALLRYRAWVLEQRLRAETELLDRLPEMLAAQASAPSQPPTAPPPAKLERIAQDLHDGPLQSLIALLLMLRADEGHDPARLLERVREGIDGTIAELREIIADIREDGLVGPDLTAALRRLAGDWTVRTGAEVTFEGPEPPPALPIDVARTLYRIAEEAIANAIRHGGASTVRMRLELGDHLSLVIADDGAGFDVAAATSKPEGTGHAGLAGMRRRAAELGGSVVVRSQPGRGTRVMARLPLPAGLRGAAPPARRREVRDVG